MKNITLETISERLIDLDEQYGKLYPQFKKVELEYIKKFDEFLMQSQTQFTNQASREANVRSLMALEPINEEYVTMSTEVRLIEVRMRNLNQISKNLVSANWNSEVYGERG